MATRVPFLADTALTVVTLIAARQGFEALGRVLLILPLSPVGCEVLSVAEREHHHVDARGDVAGIVGPGCLDLDVEPGCAPVWRAGALVHHAHEEQTTCTDSSVMRG